MCSKTTVIDVMARPRNTIPTLRKHSTSDNALVRWEDKVYYLGVFGSVEAEENYRLLCANITLHGVAIVEREVLLSIKKLATEFLNNLSKNFSPTSQEPIPIRRSILQMVEFQGEADATKYSPARLIELRQHWIERGLSVSTINKYHNYILQMFQWASIMDRLNATIWHGLKAVPKLKPLRSPAKDPKKVEPVDRKHVDAIQPFVSVTVWNIIQMQLFTGMRSGEVLSMTLRQINNNVYFPQQHKNKWRGHTRAVYLGPKARALLDGLTSGLDPDQKIFAGYTNESYGRAIKRACIKAGVPAWHPHQLRHLAGTEVRDKLGLDAAQAFLGHASAKTSEIYAKIKDDLRKKSSEELG